MNGNYFHRVHEATATRFWINNVTRKQAAMAIDAGAVGCTQNPSYTWKMMSDTEEMPYVRDLLRGILKAEPDDNEALIALQRGLIGGVAKVFQPMYEASHGKNGYVSIQGDPFREDEQSILRFARFNREAGPNIMAKVPAVEPGIAALETLIREYTPLNVTECMAVRQVLEVCEIYEKTTRNMVNPAPLYYSVITGIFDDYIKKAVARDNISISSDLTWQAGMAVARKVYELVKSRGYDCHYISGGARGLHHFTEMVGADCAVTINWAGAAEELIRQDPPVVQRFQCPVPPSVVDELCEKILDFRKAYMINAIEPEEYDAFGPVVLFRSQFEDAWKNAVANIGLLRGEM